MGKKKKLPELQKPNIEAEVYSIATIKMWLEGEKKKAQKLRFHSANKIKNYNRRRGKGNKRKKPKRIYRTSQNIRIINVFLESLLSESFPSLGVTVHLTSLGCPPILRWSLDLLSRDLAAQILIWSYSCVFLPPMSTAIRTSVFCFVGALNVLLYNPQIQSLPSWSCGFNLQLVQLVGRFWVFFINLCLYVGLLQFCGVLTLLSLSLFL